MVHSKEKVVCVGCPLGCLVTLSSNNGEVIDIDGNKCKQGESYAIEEYRNPVRILTTTLRTEDSLQPLLPVRTVSPLLKSKMFSGSVALAKVRVKPPIKLGEVVVYKSADIEADVIATADLLH